MKQLFTFALFFTSLASFGQKIGIDTTSRRPLILKQKEFRLKQSPIINFSDSTAFQSTLIYANPDNMPIKVVSGSMPNISVQSEDKMPNIFPKEKPKQGQ